MSGQPGMFDAFHNSVYLVWRGICAHDDQHRKSPIIRDRNMLGGHGSTWLYLEARSSDLVLETGLPQYKSAVSSLVVGRWSTARERGHISAGFRGQELRDCVNAKHSPDTTVWRP